MTEPTTAESRLEALPIESAQKLKRPRKAASKPARESAPREAGTWIAKHPDGGMSAHTSKKEALRQAVPNDSVGWADYGEPLPPSGGLKTEASSTHGIWVGKVPNSGTWAAFERELGALEFACPEGEVQFVKSGGVIQL